MSHAYRLYARHIQPVCAARDLGGSEEGISSDYTLEAAKHFGEFNKPVPLAWAPEERFFKMRDAERLLEAFPNARLELIEDSYTFVSIDRPERTAELIGAFAEGSPAQ